MTKAVPFGNYYLLDRINVGGMAEVFRAKAFGVEGFERLLAVKRILDSIAENRDFIEMFVDEAKIAVLLNHANIAQIYELGEVRGSYYIAMEYIHGKDLRTVFDRAEQLSVTLPVPQACFAVMKVCEGLDYAHNKRDPAGRPMQLVHRDVSPQNVLLSYEGEVKLIDFGVAKAAGNMSQTEAGVLKGKFPYMSPEQVRGLPLDRRSDIFAVGVILFELLTGQRLFARETDFATLESVRKAEVPSPRALNSEVSEILEQIVLRALARDVDDRYQSAIDLHDDLQAYLYSIGAFGTRKDLSNWLHQCFAQEIEQEGVLLATYDDLELPEPPRDPADAAGAGALAQTVPFSRSGPRGLRDGPIGSDHPAGAIPEVGPLAWSEEDAETGVFDEDGEPDTPAASSSFPSAEGGIEDFEQGLAEDSSLLVRPGAGPPPRVRQRRLVWVLVAAIVIGAASAAAAFYLFDLRGNRPRAFRVDSAPPGARVALDGKAQAGLTPVVLTGLKSGSHLVSLHKAGYRDWKRRLQVAGRGLTTVSARLQPESTATIDLRSRPSGATVYLDGRKLDDVTPLRILEVAPGQHSLEIRKTPGHAPMGSTVEVRSQQKLSLSYVLRPLHGANGVAPPDAGIAELDQ